MDHPECPICLNPIKSPVSPPCGHLYCKKCLIQHANAPNEELSCSCPTCRAPFHLVVPDLALIPKKFHPFITPAIRRIFLHIPSTNFTELQGKLQQAEERRAEKTTECENLKADFAHLAAKNLTFYHKNAELSVENMDLMNIIGDLEIELHNATEGRRTEEGGVIQGLEDQINMLGLELYRAEKQLRLNQIMAEQREMIAEERIADLERKLEVAQERIDASDREANGMSVMINDLELGSQLRLGDNEKLKNYNRELSMMIKEIGRKKELAEAALQKIAAIALPRSQQASGSTLRKRRLATPPPMASGSHLTKPLPKRRRVKIES